MKSQADESPLVSQLYAVALENLAPSAELRHALEGDPIMLEHAYRLALDTATLEAAAGGARGASRRLEELLEAAAARAAVNDVQDGSRGRAHWQRSLTRWACVAALMGLGLGLTINLIREPPIQEMSASLYVRNNATLGAREVQDAAAAQVIERTATLEILLKSPAAGPHVWLLWNEGTKISSAHTSMTGDDGNFAGLSGAAASMEPTGLRIMLPARHLPLGSDLTLRVVIARDDVSSEELLQVAEGTLSRSHAIAGVLELAPIQIVPAGGQEESP